MKNIIKINFLVLIISLFFLPNTLFAKVKIVCSNYPTYLFVKEIMGSLEAEINILGNFSVACDHDYTLTAWDLDNLSKADFFIINGLSSEENFVEKALAVSNKDKKIKIIDAGLAIKAIETKISTGEVFTNPHVFTSPKLAKEMVYNIANALAETDVDNKKFYLQNAYNFSLILNDLEEQLKKINIEENVLVGHDVFDYLAKDLNINIVAYLEESEHGTLSAARIKEILNLIREFKISYIVLDEYEDEKIALTLAEEIELKLIKLNFFSAGPENLENYAAYYKVKMEENILKLKDLSK